MFRRGSPEYSQTVAELRSTVLDAAKTLAPEVVVDGTAGPRPLEIRPRQFARTLTRRLEVEQAIVDLERDGAESDRVGWSLSEGVYHQLRDARWDASTAIGRPGSASKERLVSDKIDAALKEADGTRPVVAMDFGGGYGLSWLRIAALARHRKAIQDGRLAMVVTNLGYTPGDKTDDDGYFGIARAMNIDNVLFEQGARVLQYSPRAMDWVQDNQHLVNYADVSALELADTTIPLRDGSGTVELTDGVDVIHEHYALRHTHVPDIVLAAFDRLLSPAGTLYSDAATNYHMMHPPQFRAIVTRGDRTVTMDDHYKEQRHLGLAIGSKMLQLHGFSYTNLEDYHLAAFERPPATT